MEFVNAENLQIKQKGNNRPNSKLVSCWGKWWLDLQYNGKKLDVQRGWGWSDERPFPRRGLTFKCDQPVLVGRWTRVYLLGFHADQDIADLRLWPPSKCGHSYEGDGNNKLNFEIHRKGAKKWWFFQDDKTQYDPVFWLQISPRSLELVAIKCPAI